MLIQDADDTCTMVLYRSELQFWKSVAARFECDTCLWINNELFICNPEPGRYNPGDNLYELTALFCNCYAGNKANKWHTVLILM